MKYRGEGRKMLADKLRSLLRKFGAVVLTVVGIVVFMLLVITAMEKCTKEWHQPTKETITGPNGKPALFFQCFVSSDCIKAAAKECPNGYEVLNSGVNHLMVECK